MMIDDIINLVLGNQIEAAVLIAAGFLLGIIISLLYWSGQVGKRNRNIKDLETTVEGKDTDLKDMRVRAQELLNGKEQEIESLKNELNNTKRTLEDREKEIESLNTQLNNTRTTLEGREQEIESLNTQLGQRNESIQVLTQQISEKDESIDLLKNTVNDLEEKNRLSVTRAEDAHTKVKELEQALDEKLEESANFDKMNQNSVARAEGAEAKIVELENSLEEKTEEATGLKARIRMMQDDFTRIAGIGPKVSSVLRLAGLNTFTKLAAANVDKIKEILEKENPSLLRLTDPATWPDQARLAAQEDWEGLSALQESLKAIKRT